MICVDPEYQKCGLGKKLISKHLSKNKSSYLYTRSSNKAKELYLKMGYNHIGTVKDKYFLVLIFVETKAEHYL